MSTARTPETTYRLLTADGHSYGYYALGVLDQQGHVCLDRLPHCLKVLLENVLRAYELGQDDLDAVLALASWAPQQRSRPSVRFRPGRVLMQDFTGVPALVDLAALRDAIAETGGDPSEVNPRIPVDLVVDHSVMLEHFNEKDALQRNMARELECNAERYRFLHWAQNAFTNLRIVPPGSGICHQVNLEHLSTVVSREALADRHTLVYPDTLAGTDSHTTMVNALGVLGWGLGGIEAEAAILGRPLELVLPDVVGVHLRGRLPDGAGAADLALTLTERLRREGVVGTFVEFYGDGLDSLALPDRATLANMAPEYGATCAFFPVDGETISYLAATGRRAADVALVETYAKAQGWWRHPGAAAPAFSRVVDLDLGAATPCLAGPRRPQERVALPEVASAFDATVRKTRRGSRRSAAAEYGGSIADGSVVVAAITSCTNTSNPSAMITAGLLARAARTRGLETKAWVRASLAPGSRVVSDYLARLGLQDDLDALGFATVAYGCGACVGNTAPLARPLADAVQAHDLHVAAVISGNRNFEGRVGPLIKATYLASPALVVAYAIAGTVRIDLTREPLGLDADAAPIYLSDIWPDSGTLKAALAQAITPAMYQERYRDIFMGGPAWRSMAGPRRPTYPWEAHSTFIRRPPFLQQAEARTTSGSDIAGARILLLLGDGITTDHISPAGPIAAEGPAADYLKARQVDPRDFNSFGARRGNHEVMIRGAFGNPQLRNLLTPEAPGGFTRCPLTGQVVRVFDAAESCRQHGVPLVIVAGKDYGGGSSRDWAAKATALLGVKAVIAESFERIHRANLISLGVLPLQFPEGVSWRALGLDGSETLTISAPCGRLAARGRVTLTVRRDPPAIQMIDLYCRIDSAGELAVLTAGGLLPLLLDSFCREASEATVLRGASAGTGRSGSPAGLGGGDDTAALLEP